MTGKEELGLLGGLQSLAECAHIPGLKSGVQLWGVLQAMDGTNQSNDFVAAREGGASALAQADVCFRVIAAARKLFQQQKLPEGG